MSGISTMEDQEGNSDLHNACCKSNLDLVQGLLHSVTDPRGKIKLLAKKNSSGKNCFHMAVKYAGPEIIQLLLDYLPTEDILELLNKKDNECRTPLCLATRNKTSGGSCLAIFLFLNTWIEHYPVGSFIRCNPPQSV